MKKRDQGVGFRVWGLGSLIGVGCFITLGCSLAVARGTESKAENLRMIVRVHDYAGVSRDTLERAEQEVGRIFRKLGIETTWVDCPLTQSELAQYPACLHPFEAPRIDMNILPRFMATQLSQPDTTLGFTSFVREGVRSSLGTVFYDRVKDQAQRTTASVPAILACAMAHEMGHLLLRTSGHSSIGIMRARWTAEDMQRIACGQLLFTPEQAELMRTEVSERAQL